MQQSGEMQGYAPPDYIWTFMMAKASGWTRTRRGTLYEDHCPPNSWILTILQGVNSQDGTSTDSKLLILRSLQTQGHSKKTCYIFICCA